MVFESVVVDVLNRFLGDYVENLDSKQLQIGIWGGDVVLQNLILKQNALAELDLPLQVFYGRLEKLVLKIPWKNLYGSAVEATIDGLYLLALPNKEIAYDAGKEEKKLLEAKRLELQRLEAVKRKEKEKDLPKADDTFVEKLTTQIIRNVQLTIRNIHVRYEDKVTNQNNPFALGVTLSNLCLVSTDKSWKPAIVTDGDTKIYKIVDLEGLAVYMNCNSVTYSNLPVEEIITHLKKEIASKTTHPDSYHYVLGPINSASRLRLNTKPECDTPAFSIPKIHLNVEMEKLFVAVRKNQYRDFVGLAESMDRMSKGAPYRKYRPNLHTYRGHYKDWWQFAYNCILEENVRKRRRNWDWNYINQHRETCRKYGELYQQKVQNRKLPKQEQNALLECEDKLDVFNVVLIRQRIELEMERLGKLQQSVQKKSWFSSWWKSEKTEDEKDLETTINIVSRFEEAMSADEKSRLYKAIDYQENSAPTELPKEFINTTCMFVLQQLRVELIDGNQSVLISDLNSVKCRLDARPAANAICFGVNIESLVTTGLKQAEYIPHIIQTEKEKVQTGALLDVVFETNPLDETCGQKLSVNIAPIRVTYDSKTFIKVAEIFKSPASTKLENLSSAAESSLLNIKEMSAIGLQHAIDQHTFFLVNINIYGPILILPHEGKYTGRESALIVNLGRLIVTTEPRKMSPNQVKHLHESGAKKDEVLSEMRSKCYDVYCLGLTELQIILMEVGADWQKYMKQTESTEMHLLNPMNFHLKIQKCLISDDPRLPLIKGVGNLPSLSINIADARLVMLVGLILSVPLPSEDELKTEPLTKQSHSKSSSALQMIQDLATERVKTADPKALLKMSIEKQSKDIVQLTKIDLKFIMSEFKITFNHQSNLTSAGEQIMQIKLSTLELSLTQQTFNTIVGLRLASVSATQFFNDACLDVISTPFSDTENPYLVSVEFLQVDKKSPEFHSKYNSSESTLILKLDCLSTVLHQEALLTLIKYITDMQTEINTIKSSMDRIATAGHITTTQSIPLKRQTSQISDKKPISDTLLSWKKTQKAVRVETIIFKLKASLNTLSVELTTNKMKISAWAVKGINSEIIIKKPYTQINAKLVDLSIVDLNPETLHKQIVTVSDEFALSTQIVLHKSQPGVRRAEHNPDVFIELAMGRIKIIYLNWFVTNILNFIGNFETAQEMIVEASAAAATQARQNMQSVYEKATKVSLVVDLKAPQLIVPTNSKSRDALVLNMGNLTLRNKFITVEQQKIEKEHVVVDDLRLTLTDFKLLRVLLDEEENAIESCVLLEPVTFAVGVERNLCSAWFTTIPDLDISGQIDSISLEVSKGDYAMVMSMLSGNLAEGQKAYAKTIQSKPIIMSTQSSEVISTGRSVMTDVLLEHPQDQEARVAHVFLKFTFTMNNFTVRLYEGGSAHSIASPSHKTMTSLGKLSVDGLSIKGRMMTDDSMIVSLILVDCELDDTRKERQGMLTRMIERSQHQTPVPEKNKADLFSTCKSMIDVTLQRTPDDTFADIRIFSFTVILAVEYLMRLAEFFQIEEPETKLAVAKSKTSNIAEQKSQTTVVFEPRKNPIQIKINIKVEKPDIILVEHMKNVNTDALILNCELVLHTRMVDVHQVISGTIKDIQVFTCCYNPTRRQETKSDVLSPITISVAGSTPDNQGLHLEVVFSPVRIRVSPDTIELLNNIIETMTGKVEKLSEETDDFSLTEEGESSIWNFKEFKENEHWFLKVDEAVEAFEIIPEIMSLDRKCDIVKRELCIVTAPVLVVTMEVGVGSKTHPMLLMECSFCGNINDWSSQMTVDASLSFQMEYYNSNLALWEPLIEPVEIHKNNKISYTPWELRFELTKSLNNLNDSLSPADSEQDIQPQPTTHISISSINNLEITVSQNCLDVLKNLGKAFSEAMKHDKVMGEAVKRAPYTVKNYLGTPVKLCLSKSSFCVFEQEDSGKLEVILQHGAEAPLELKVPEMLDKVQSIKLSTLSNADASDERVLNVKIDQVYCELNLPVKKADKRYFPLNYRLNSKESWGLVSDITAENGVLTITLRSILRIYNHLKIPVDAYYLTVRGNELECISTIEPGESLDVPLHALYSPTGEVFFSVNGFSVTKIPYVWRDLQQNLSVTSVLKCDFKEEGEIKKPAFLLKVVGEIEQVFFETTLRHTMNSTCYNMHLRPTVILKNCLPVKIIVCGQNTVEENELGPGENLHLPYVEPGNSYLVIRLPIYLEKEWSCRRDVAVNPPAFSVWEFNSHQGLTKATLDLGMHVLPKHDSIIMSLYCPFWMLNKTGLQLSYRSDENLNVLHHPPTFKGPILFSFNAKNFFGKKKAAIRVDQGQWSDKFSLDVAGSSGVIVCKGENMIYQIGVQNQLTYNGFTKQVTFTPFYVIINNAPYAIECQELDRPADPWIVVEKKSCTALWPKSERDDKLLRLRVVGTTEISAPFLFTESHTTLLKLHNKFAGIDVDIQMTEGGIYINLSSYEPGMAPALIMNHTKQTMHFWEKETVQIRKLPPMHSFLYTWENPSGPRILVWEIGHKKEIEDDLRKDGVGEFSPIKDTIVYWVSFLDGMQRVLLFTPDKSVAEGAQSAKNFELVQQEVDVSIHGMGLSLVKSDKRQEILYIGIASSGVIWESSKLNSKRFKQMKTRDCLNIEAAYQEYLAKSQVSSEDQSRVFIDNRQMEVDFNEGLMLKPHKRRIRRTFLTGLWLQMKSGPSQLQLHAKINRLQIDNQMVDCIFPVVLAPVPPPRSVAADFVHKPFVEVSIVQLLIKHSQIKQFKYFKILIQEFHIKVDLGFVNALVEMLQTVGNTESEELQQFEADMKLVDEPLYSHVFTQSLQEQKSFYDMLHFSPLKIHVSFSLATASGQPGFTTPNFLTVLLQGLGVTLTDMQDVVFKLAYFQREYNFLTKRQLVNETISHYMGQLVKQLYVLVLGLDVLGNPYGLVLGITKGVEDLFYEPFQGAIQGPGEFAEGVMLGVRSLFGHTVGGAAGAVSRITGAMGKGIAVLTFDDDFQRKRRDQINKKPASVQEGIARGGKGLVMGVVDGVTGVFTKPISGAMEQGVEGFFTGLGKGAVGLFTRPTAGVIDFASGSLDAVKRVTEMGEEVNRLRPPRFFHADGYIRPYNHHDAEGNKLLNELEKGKFASTDVYSCHYNIVGKKEILLFTDKRIAYITHNDIFGYWQVEWSYTWSELQQNPVRVDAKGVCVMAAESKKKKLGLFGGSDSGKLILIASPELKDEIARVIEQHRQAA